MTIRLLDVTDSEDWKNYGACVGTDADLFFPDDATNSQAKAICAGCVVREKCLAHALTVPELYGIWGGKTARQRRSMRARRARGVA